jgi:hypothetical protein
MLMIGKIQPKSCFSILYSFLSELLQKVSFDWIRKYGGIYRLWFMVRPMVVIAAPEMMQV